MSLWEFWTNVVSYLHDVVIAAFILKAVFGSEIILFAMLYFINRFDTTLEHIPAQLSKLLSVQFLLFFATQIAVTVLLYYVIYTDG